MALRQTTGDMSVFTLAGASQLGLFRSTTLSMEADTVEASPGARRFMRPQVVKKGGTLNTELMSVVSGSVKVQHTDLSAMSLDSVSYLTGLTGTFSAEYTTQEADGAGAIWRFPQVTKVGFRFSGTVRVPAATGGAQALLADAWSATHTDHSMVLTFTINGVATTLPMVLTSASLAFEDGGFQTIAIELMGQAPDSGTYPTAPTGTTTLYEKALNASETAIAWALTTHATEGVAFSGNAVFSSMSLGIEDGALINVQYGFATQGAVTATSN